MTNSGIIVLGDCTLSAEIAGELRELGRAHDVRIVISNGDPKDKAETAIEKVQRRLDEICLEEAGLFPTPIKNKHQNGKPYYRQKERW